MKFEWDEKKAAANLRRHGVSFEEGVTAFADWHSITVPDPDHSTGEQRYYLLGASTGGGSSWCATRTAETTRVSSACGAQIAASESNMKKASKGKSRQASVPDIDF